MYTGLKHITTNYKISYRFICSFIHSFIPLFKIFSNVHTRILSRIKMKLIKPAISSIHFKTPRTGSSRNKYEKHIVEICEKEMIVRWLHLYNKHLLETEWSEKVEWELCEEFKGVCQLNILCPIKCIHIYAIVCYSSYHMW